MQTEWPFLKFFYRNDNFECQSGKIALHRKRERGRGWGGGRVDTGWRVYQWRLSPLVLLRASIFVSAWLTSSLDIPVFSVLALPHSRCFAISRYMGPPSAHLNTCSHYGDSKNSTVRSRTSRLLASWLKKTKGWGHRGPLLKIASARNPGIPELVFLWLGCIQDF